MIEKILEKFRAKSDEWLDIFEKSNYWDTYADGMCDAFDEAIQIVQEVANEYVTDTNVGKWIPVETELPKTTNDYLVTKMCENDGNPIYETAHEIFWTTDGKWDCERDEYCDWKVIAWQNKVAPYQKGE